MFWIRKTRTIAIDDLDLILKRAMDLVREGAELRQPTYPAQGDEESPLSLAPDDTAFIVNGGSEPVYEDDDQNDEAEVPEA